MNPAIILKSLWKGVVKVSPQVKKVASALVAVLLAANEGKKLIGKKKKK